MKDLILLCDVETEASYIIQEIGENLSIETLASLGISVGKKIKKLRKPFGKSPSEYYIDDSYVSIRHHLAEKIWVKKDN